MRVFSDARAMLAHAPFDYVVVSSPPHLHAEHVQLSLDRGAFVYLEKPPAPTIHQLEALLRHPRADRVAVGFQLLETQAFSGLKQKLVQEGLKIRRICASGLWTRSTWYYRRATWAGRLTLGERTVFDGPLTNAFAHLVHGVCYLAGEGECGFAVPQSVRGRLLRARPIESGDFGWMWIRTRSGIEIGVMAGHCFREMKPWKITVHTDGGSFAIREQDLRDSTRELLVDAHRRTLAAARGNGRVPTRLKDCLGYSLSTCGSFLSSQGVRNIPAGEITVTGEGDQRIFHVAALSGLAGRIHRPDFDPDEVPSWLQLGGSFSLTGAHALPPDFLSGDESGR